MMEDKDSRAVRLNRQDGGRCEVRKATARILVDQCEEETARSDKSGKPRALAIYHALYDVGGLAMLCLPSHRIGLDS